MAAAGVALEFELPRSLEASAPPEARGLRRDDVRLLVSDVARGSNEHARFRDLPRFLSPGDVLVVNVSGTLPAALQALGQGGEQLELHLSTQLPGGFWTVEVRLPGPDGTLPYRGARAGDTFTLPNDAQATLLAPYPFGTSLDAPSRLWIATVAADDDLHGYLGRFGFAIRYRYVARPWPMSTYQTIFAQEPGSAEMPSAGRPFTPELVTTLVARGVQIVPLVLHTGVSSLEDHEPPYEEFYRVPRDTADRVTAARRAGRRIVAVGTTAVRALETVTDNGGVTSPGEGWTSIVVSAERPVRSVDGLVTGLHEPRATHLMMLEEVIRAARRHHGISGSESEILERAYAEALERRYLWHEFGDSHFIF